MTRHILFLLLCALLCSGCARVADLDAEVAAAIYEEGLQLVTQADVRLAIS